MENADLTHMVFQLFAKWIAATPKNLQRRSLPNERDEHFDGYALLHVKDYLAVSAITSSPYTSAIQAIAVHMQLRYTRYREADRDYRTDRKLRHIEEAVQYIDILEDEENIVTRVRILAHTYQVLAEAFAKFLSLHPRWRRQANELRAEAYDTFSIAESSSESNDEMDTQ